MDKTALRTWLLDYAWNGTTESTAAEVECILSQPGAQEHIVEATQEHYRGMVESPGDPAQVAQADGFVLSALYECHDAPHLTTCPHYRGAS